MNFSLINTGVILTFDDVHGLSPAKVLKRLREEYDGIVIYALVRRQHPITLEDVDVEQTFVADDSGIRMQEAKNWHLHGHGVRIMSITLD